jgi:Ulp1 protease family, C-terminal catalytic domain
MELAKPGKRRRFPPILLNIPSVSRKVLQRQRRWLRDSRGWNGKWRGTYLRVQDQFLRALVSQHPAAAFIPSGILKQKFVWNAQAKSHNMVGPAVLNTPDFNLNRGNSDFLVIPVHQPTHTYGYLVDIPNRMFYCVDAFHGNHATTLSCTSKLRKVLRTEFGFAFKYKLINPARNAMVVDGDCGPFVINWIEKKLLANNEQVNHKTLNNLKNRLAEYLEGKDEAETFPQAP